MIYFVIVLLISLNAFSQKNIYPVTHNEIIAGKNYLTGQNIHGQQYSFPCYIYRWSVDSARSRVTLELRDKRANGKDYKRKGFLSVFDLKNNKVLWSHDCLSFDIIHSDSIILRSIGEGSFRLDENNGTHLWKSTYTVFFYNQSYNIGLAYYMGLNKLKGINLTDGTVEWERKIDNKYGWEDIKYLNDSVILVVSSGLHTINLKTGKGWDYNAVTAINNYGASFASLFAGIVFGSLTGVFIYYAPGSIVINNINSNVVITEDKIYFSSRDKVVCLDMEGNVIWETELVKKLSGRSSIFINNGFLYVLNLGIATKNNSETNRGKSFLIKYDINYGRPKYFKLYSDYTKAPINGFEIQKDTLILIFNNKISKQLLSDGSIIWENFIDNSKYGKPLFFIGEQVFTTSDNSTFYSIVLSDTTKYYIYTESGNIYSINKALSRGNIIENEKTYINYLNYNGYGFLAHENKTIITKNNKAVATLNVSENSFIIGSTLYDFQDNDLIEIDLNNIIPN